MAVTNQELFNIFLANPNMSDAQIVSLMETRGISPEQISSTFNIPVGEVAARVGAVIPPNQAVLLGDTYVQAINEVIGSGEDQQVGALENVITYKATDNRAGGAYTQYTPTGEIEQTGTQQEVKSGLKEFALGAGLLFGLPTLLNAGAVGAPAIGNGAFLGEGVLSGVPAFDAAFTSAGGVFNPAFGLPVGNGAFLGEGVPTGIAASDTAFLNAGGTFNPAFTLAPDGLLGTPLVTPPVVTTPPTGVPPTGVPPTGVPPTGVPPTGVPPTGVPPTGVPPTGVPPIGVPPVGIPPITVPTVADITRLAQTGLTAAQIAALLSTGTQTAAGLLQQQTSKEAAVKAQAMIDAETAAAKTAAQFRPIGMTTRFGTSQFQVDPITGRLTSAGYTLSPEAKAQQDRLMALSNQGLTQAEQAQAKFAPLQTGAQSLFGLGQGILNAPSDTRVGNIASQYLSQSPQSQRLTALGGDYLTQSPESKMLTSLGSKYIAQSPEQVAQNYLNQQMALLQPGRETELANLQNRLQQQGRGGLSVAQGGTLGATTPELQALYNARAMQEAQLAAQAQQAGQQQVQFGAGLVGTGQQLGMAGQQFGANLIGTGQQLGIQGQQFGIDALARQQALEQQRVGFGSGLFSQGAGLMGQYYGGQQAAYAPFTSAFGQMQALESAAQQPFQLGVGLGKETSTAGYNVGRLGLMGAGQSVALATGADATRNPYAYALGGISSNPLFTDALTKIAGGTPVNALDFGAYGKGDAGFQKMLDDIYG